MKIFISYAHKDSRYFEEVRTHLKPLTRGKGGISAWSDQDIKLGDDWRGEIRSSIESCNVAILLVSANFLASDFIIEEELSPLFDRYDAGDTQIICIPVSHCAFSRDVRLSKIQCVPTPEKPLSGLGKAKRDQAYEAVGRRIEDLAGLSLAAGRVVSAAGDPETPAQKAPPPGKYNGSNFKDAEISIVEFWKEKYSSRNENGQLSGYVFENCTITGPAILYLALAEIRDANFLNRDKSIDSYIFTKVKTSKFVTGLIHFSQVKFIRCKFLSVGFYENNPDSGFVKGILASSNLEVS